MGLDWSKVSDQEKQYPLHEETPWPETDDRDEAANFKFFMLNHYDTMQKLGIRLMSHIAEGLGKPANFFDQWFMDDTCSTFRIIRYLPRTGAEAPVSKEKLSGEQLKFTTPIHTDSGFLTLLSTFGFGGLQVDVGNGVYRSVRPVANSIVVNFGDMLSRITENHLKSTKHRVMDIGVERYSSPFFLEPYFDAKIPD